MFEGTPELLRSYQLTSPMFNTDLIKFEMDQSGFPQARGGVTLALNFRTL